MKILFLGDICTDSYSDSSISEFKKTKLYTFLVNYEGVIVGNLEAPLLENILHENKNKFSLVNSLINKGLFDFCSVYNLGNNHIFDQGLNGYIETVNNLKLLNKNFLGAGYDLESSRKPCVIKCGEKKVALLSYCCFSTNSEMYSNSSSPGPTPLIYEFIKEDIDRLKGHEIDHIFVLPHWGVENEFFPTYDQASLARKIIDLGVDSIVGSHTHTLQAFETFNGKNIYYSLGNLFFTDFDLGNGAKYYQGRYNKEGLIVEVDLSMEQPKFKELYIKLNSDSIPEIVEKDSLLTPVDKNNRVLSDNLVKFEYKKLLDNLDLRLRFNGKSMQIINNSPFIGHSYKPRIESYVNKLKRVLVYMIKKFMR